MDLGACGFQSGLLHIAPSTSALRGVRALVLVGGKPAMERFGDLPLALLDVLGRSVLMRTLDRLRAAGIGETLVVSDTEPLPPQPCGAGFKLSVVSPADFWPEAFQHFRRLGRHSERVLVLRLGAWAELDFAAMVSQHRLSGSSLVRAYSPRQEALDMLVVSSGSQAEAAALFRGELRGELVGELRGETCGEPIAAAPHVTGGYVNLLSSPASLRILALDAFAGNCAIRPCGRELRPGIWIGTGAHLHRNARVVAPAYIGSFCNVRRAALITRGSSLEHHSEVDCATVIDSSSVMPYARVGAGLDVEHSVVGFRQVHSIPRNTTVEIEDPRLIGATTAQHSFRTLGAVGWLLSLLPKVLWRLLFEPSPEAALEAAPKALPPATVAGEALLTPIESKTEAYPAREMVVPRRYGNE